MVEATPVSMVEIGSVVFDGAMFGGRHEVRLMLRKPEGVVAMVCDGVELHVRTVRGARAALVRRVCREVVRGD